MPEITGLVLTFNGERLLEKCLRSLDFCDRLLCIDSGSTDETLAIAEGLGAEVVRNPWSGAIEQHRFALTRIETPWVITLDQDEYLSPELRQDVIRALQDPGDLAGFYCSRRSFYFDRFIRHCGWYPDWLFRVYRTDRIRIEGMRPHEELRPMGQAGRLSGDIVHEPYSGFFEHLHKINIYTQDAAEALAARGKTCGVAGAFGHAVSRFLKIYLFKGGVLDGRAGLLVAVHGFLYSLHKYLRLAEIRLREGKDHD